MMFMMKMMRKAGRIPHVHIPVSLSHTIHPAVQPHGECNIDDQRAKIHHVGGAGLTQADPAIC